LPNTWVWIFNEVIMVDFIYRVVLILAITSFFGACEETNSWPPETKGPNLPVRYCDINKGDNDEAVIGYVFVDTVAVNWMLPNLLKESTVFEPSLYDLRRAEQILQKAFPSILKDAYDKDGHLFQKGGLDNYARQYAFLKGSDGKKYAFVNFVLLEIADLEDKPAPQYQEGILPPLPFREQMNISFIFVMDGGDAYWRAMLDLDKGELLWHQINGHA